MHRTKFKNLKRTNLTSRPLRRPIPPARHHDACTVSTCVRRGIVPVNAMVNALSCPDHCTFAPLAALTCTYIYTQLVCKLTIPKNDPHSNRVVVGGGVVHYRDGSHFGNENDHDLRSLRLSAAARSIVGVKTNFRDRNRGGQNRRSSERRDSIAMPARGSREPDAQIRCLAARHACYGPACYGSAETSLTGILCHPVGAILTTSWIAEERPVVDDPRICQIR